MHLYSLIILSSDKSFNIKIGSVTDTDTDIRLNTTPAQNGATGGQLVRGGVHIEALVPDNCSKQ